MRVSTADATGGPERAVFPDATDPGGVVSDELGGPYQYEHTYAFGPSSTESGVVAYELDPRTGQTVVSHVTEGEYVDWLRGKAYAEDVDWYPWANPSLDWSSWYDYLKR